MRAYGYKPGQSQGKMTADAGNRAPNRIRDKALLRTRPVAQTTPERKVAPPIVHTVLSSPGKPLDSKVRSSMEPRFGHDFSRVRVHTDARATESADLLNARAYTVGADIVFSQGEYLPATGRGRALLAHELAHVVQQRSTGNSLQTKMEIGDPSDSAEHEAEIVARRALAQENAPPQSPAAFRLAPPLMSQSASPPVLRRSPKSSWAGEFTDDEYKVGFTEDRATKEIRPHATIRILFTPNQKVDAEKIAFVQTADTSKNGQAYALNTVVESRMIQSGIGQGIHIDAHHAARTPLAAMNDPQSGDKLSDSQETDLSDYGKRLTIGNMSHMRPAQTADAPGITVSVADEAKMYLETAAMAVQGAQQGVYYGAVKWGWTKKSGAKQPEKIEFALASQDAPSGEVFQQLGTLWDASKTSKGQSTIHLPTIRSMYTKKKVKLVDDPAKPQKGVDVNPNTHVEVTERSDSAHKDWRHVMVIEGDSMGKMGWVMDADLTAQKPITDIKKKGAK